MDHVDKIITGLLPLAVDIDAIVTLEGNPRDGDIESVMRSLEEFGQRKPVVVRVDTNEIEAGNHTFLAAQRLGWTRIAAVYVEDDAIRAKAFALADNRTAELGDMNDELLATMIQEVLAEDEALLHAASYDEEFLRNLTEEPLPEDEGEPRAKPAAVIAYNLIFDNEAQQARFYDFVRWLKLNEQGETVAERFDHYLHKADLG